MAKQTISFTPKARLIKILGEHLIKDATVGIVELVKNSYDADATTAEIQMISLNKPNAKIIIKDNGTGIDLSTFLKKWMNPATGHKEDQKILKERSKLRRLPLGEKGVGRFAAQQIGNTFKMISKTNATEQELVVDIDWKKFDSNTLDLKDVEIEYKMELPQYFKKRFQTGTILEISDLKYRWGEDDIKRISNTLKRMKSPFKGSNNFDVSLQFVDCPIEFEKHSNLELDDILDRAHYKLYGLVDSNGIMDFEYDFNVPGFDKVHREGKINLRVSAFNEKEIITCGGFIVNLHHYVKKNDANWLQKSGITPRDVEELSGVSIYRDGIRILPYGEKGNDWLKLDSKRIQDSSRIGNDTIIGMVEINQEENVQLKDKTNREGLIENPSYYQFEKLVNCAIDILDKEKKVDRPKKEKAANSNDDVNKKIEKAKTQLNKVAAKVSQSTDEGVRESLIDLKQVEANFDDIKKQFSQTVDEYESVNKVLYNLAGTGLAAERFTHEFARLIAGANTSLDRLRKQVDLENARIKKEIDTISGVLEALRNDIRLLGPMFYIKKVANEKDLDVLKIIENTLSLQESAINRENIKVEIAGEPFKIKMREGSCMQVFNNVIDNAIHWLSKKSEEDDRKIKIITDFKSNSVYISDNGPGVTPRYRDKIFDSFFSMKGEEGRGLGLYIIKEILDEKNWSILLVNQEDFPGLLRGASFKIIFSDNK